MGLKVYVDGKHVASIGSASGWDAAARWIQKHTANRTPLRRLAELGETYQPEQAAAMLSHLLEHQKPAPNIEHTLRDLYHFLTGDHVLITDGVIDEPYLPPAAMAAVLLLSMVVVGGAGFQVYRSPDMFDRVAHNLAPYLDVARTTYLKPVKTTVAMVPDSDATDKMRQQLKKNLRADVQYIGKLFDAKMKAARYRVCYMYDNDKSTRAFQEYLKGNAECIELSPNKKNILILGDSVAADLYMAVSRAYPEIHFLEITGSACKPFLKAYHGEYPACEQLIQYALNFAEKTKLDGVIIGSSWADDYQLIRQELRRLLEAGHKLLLVGPPLKFSAEVALIVERLSANDRLDAALERTLVKEDVLRADEMAGFAASEKATYLNWEQLYCTQGCPVLNEQGALLILDKFHLTVPGADRLGERIKEHRVLETAFQLQ